MDREEKQEIIPIWDGDEDGSENYKERVFWHLRGVESWKKNLQLAKLAQTLKGLAWKRVANLAESEKDKLQSSPETYMQFRKNCLVRGPVAETGALLIRYLLKCCRGQGESMKTFMDRHHASLQKLETTLRGVMSSSARPSERIRKASASCRLKIELDNNKGKKSVACGTSVAGSPRSAGRNSGAAAAEETTGPEVPRVWKRQQPDQEEEEDEEDEQDANEEDKKSSGTVSEKDWKQESSWWQTGWQQKWTCWPRETAATEFFTKEEQLEWLMVKIADKIGRDSEDMKERLPVVDEQFRQELLPIVLTGWMLPQRSRLSAIEQATILSAASMKAKLENQAVLDQTVTGTVLKTQWEESELREGDGRTRPAANSCEDTMPTKEQETQQAEQSAEDDDSGSEKDSETAQLLTYLRTEDPTEAAQVTEALAARDQARESKKVAQKSLVQARAIIREVRKNRVFFPRKKIQEAKTVGAPGKPAYTFKENSQRRTPTPFRSKSPNGDNCFRCGKPGHQARECKQLKPMAAKGLEDADFIGGLKKDSDSSSSSDSELEKLKDKVRIKEEKKKNKETEAEGATKKKAAVLKQKAREEKKEELRRQLQELDKESAVKTKKKSVKSEKSESRTRRTTRRHMSPRGRSSRSRTPRQLSKSRGRSRDKRGEGKKRNRGETSREREDARRDAEVCVAKKVLAAKEEELRLGRELLQIVIRAQKEKEDISRSGTRVEAEVEDSEDSYSEVEPVGTTRAPKAQEAFHKQQTQVEHR